MNSLRKVDYSILYTLWAVMFLLTAALGFLFPAVTGAAERVALCLTAVLFFLPPWAIVAKAKAEENKKHVRIVRYLSISSILLTIVLLCANLMSAGMSEAMGNALNAALIIISAPMVCSNFFVLPLFLWGALLMGTFGKK